MLAIILNLKTNCNIIALKFIKIIVKFCVNNTEIVKLAIIMISLFVQYDKELPDNIEADDGLSDH